MYFNHIWLQYLDLVQPDYENVVNFHEKLRFDMLEKNQADKLDNINVNNKCFQPFSTFQK